MRFDENLEKIRFESIFFLKLVVMLRLMLNLLNCRTFCHARTQFGFFRRNLPFSSGGGTSQPCSAGVKLAGVAAGDAGDRADGRDAVGGAEERAEGRAGEIVDMTVMRLKPRDVPLLTLLSLLPDFLEVGPGLRVGLSTPFTIWVWPWQ